THSLSLDQLVFLFGKHIVNVNSSGLMCCLSCDRSSPHRDRVTLHVLIEVPRESVVGNNFIKLAFRTIDDCRLDLTKAGRQSDQRVEHRLKIKGGAAYDFEHPRCCGLLLQCLGKFACPVVELLLQISGRESATARSCWLPRAPELWRLTAARL